MPARPGASGPTATGRAGQKKRSYRKPTEGWPAVDILTRLARLAPPPGRSGSASRGSARRMKKRSFFQASAASPATPPFRFSGSRSSQARRTRSVLPSYWLCQ